MIMLVLARFNYAASVDRSEYASDSLNGEYTLFSASEFKLVLPLLLQILREKDLFAQDVSCMAICNLFAAASLLDKSLTDFISNEVITILTRERKLSQPPGLSINSNLS